MSLNEYIQLKILQPLALKNISMFPTSSMKEKLAYMNFRDSVGKVSPHDHILRRPLLAKNKEDVESCFNSGGAGCFAKPQEYARQLPEIHYCCATNSSLEILAMLLNNGTSAKTGAQILQKSTVDEMFRNQIPDFPNFGRQSIPAAKQGLTNPIPELYPIPGDGPQGWGLTFMLTGGVTGRSPGTAQWAGLPNLWWWCDREKGVAGIICTQVLPFADLKVLELWGGIETAVYGGLIEKSVL
jgi:CubicO group peptidase (beta-lactamase class C family)